MVGRNECLVCLRLCGFQVGWRLGACGGRAMLGRNTCFDVVGCSRIMRGQLLLTGLGTACDIAAWKLDRVIMWRRF